ncbi:hypothetical protein HYY72_05475 [Candidatus Woesearchaeota archaeon]|nr:hypothetical protein [Candidatus Woesearchaeota archaeon]
MKLSKLETLILERMVDIGLLSPYEPPDLIPSIIPGVYLADARLKDLIGFKPERSSRRYAVALINEIIKSAAYGALAYYALNS